MKRVREMVGWMCVLGVAIVANLYTKFVFCYRCCCSCYLSILFDKHHMHSLCLQIHKYESVYNRLCVFEFVTDENGRTQHTIHNKNRKPEHCMKYFCLKIELNCSQAGRQAGSNWILFYTLHDGVVACLHWIEP